MSSVFTQTRTNKNLTFVLLTCVFIGWFGFANTCAVAETKTVPNQVITENSGNSSTNKIRQTLWRIDLETDPRTGMNDMETDRIRQTIPQNRKPAICRVWGLRQIVAWKCI